MHSATDITVVSSEYSSLRRHRLNAPQLKILDRRLHHLESDSGVDSDSNGTSLSSLYTL